jgi:hypothetical protein
MRRVLLRAGVVALLGSAGLGVALALAPGQAERALDAWLLLLGAVALAVGVSATARAVGAGAPSRFDAAVARRPPPAFRLEELVEMERLVTAASASELEAHRRLRPVLRRIVEARGEDEELGPELWELARPDRELGDRTARGPDVERLTRIVDELERIGR